MLPAITGLPALLIHRVRAVVIGRFGAPIDVAIRAITGKSGLAIMEAILGGNRDPYYLASLVDVRTKKSQEKKPSKYTPAFDLSNLAYPYFQTDLFAISGISYNTVLYLLTTMRRDIHKFSSAKRFASWLRLVPNNKISGGRIISHRTSAGKSYLASALRQAANSIGNQTDHKLTPFSNELPIRKVESLLSPLRLESWLTASARASCSS